MTHVIHQPIAEFVLGIPSDILTICTIVLTVLIAADFAISFQTAMDLRNVLIAMEKGREELQRIQRRLDVIIAVMDDTREELVEEVEQRKEQAREQLEQAKDKWKETIQESIPGSPLDSREMVNEIEERLTRLKKAIYEHPNKYLESIRDEVSEIRGKFSMQSVNRARHAISDFHKRNLILGNPSMSSQKYNDMLAELRKEISVRKQQKKDEKNKSSETKKEM